MSKETINLNGKNILVTGSPGFIGANLVLRLLVELASGTIVSLDNMNDYYEVSLKEWRLAEIEKTAESSPVKHVFIRGSIGDKALVNQLFNTYHFDVVVNLAAQAANVKHFFTWGVRTETWTASNGTRRIRTCIPTKNGWMQFNVLVRTDSIIPRQSWN